MDIVSHALWGGVGFGRSSKKMFAAACAIGALPDAIPFTVPFAAHVWNGIVTGAVFSPPRPGSGYEGIPEYVFSLYGLTHSLLVFAVVFGIAFAVLRRPPWILGAWGLHIFTDIFTHSRDFFPTPVFWPLSDATFDGVSWGTPWIFIPNLALLAAAYAWWWYRTRIERGSHGTTIAEGR